MNRPDLSDVQGLTAFGYGKLTEAVFLLLRVANGDAAREWIAAAPVSTAEHRDTAPDTALQIAFTQSGLRALSVPETAMAGFSVEFLDGMTEESRSRRLGDIAASDPARWLWGGPGSAVHAVVILYAKQNLETWRNEIQKAPWSDGFEIVATLFTSDMGGHEPFGFVDGISQPEFDWKREQPFTATALDYNNRIALGELLLGYPNEYGKYTERPLLEPAADGAGELAAAEDDASRKDFGRNGTYLVLRQLDQDVRGFWQCLARAAGDDAEGRCRLGAAMVGRQIDGEPLIPASSHAIGGVTDTPGAPRNAFTYYGDPAGRQCPLGAHIRRANPRNADLFGHPGDPIAATFNRLAIPRPRMHDDLMASTRFHRVLRRGREYGPRLLPDDAIQPAPAGDPPRGLHFACLCANLSRQFEFVQNAWIMSTKFNGMTEESDPLLGNRSAAGDCPVTGNFSMPRESRVPERLTGVPQFVTVRGGSYFFLPSLKALRYITRAAKPGLSR